jgi:hypothetical protein
VARGAVARHLTDSGDASGAPEMASKEGLETRDVTRYQRRVDVNSVDRRPQRQAPSCCGWMEEVREGVAAGLSERSADCPHSTFADGHWADVRGVSGSELGGGEG